MGQPLTIPLDQARRYLLIRQGLMGKRAFAGREGVFSYIRQAGSIQFDPLNVCGRNADLTLQSRVANYAPGMLYGLLYEERRLVDYFDKELCVFPADQWPHYTRVREIRGAWMRSHEQVAGARDAILAAIRERGALSSKDLDTGGKVNWFWGKSRLSRAVLEHLYYAGTLGIHHKQGAIKHYDLMERLLPEAWVLAPDPHETLESLQLYLLKRRIGAVGLMWNKSSPAFLGIPEFTAAARQRAFGAMMEADALTEIRVAGLRDPFYLLREDVPLLLASKEAQTPRCELIAPLDPLMWDRALIEALFGFSYTWEVYVPAAKRAYGYYVLPLLQGERFIGRAEPVYDKKARCMTLKGLWYEPGVKESAALRKATQGCLGRFERFLHRNAQALP